MLVVIRSMRDLRFGELMRVYEQSNLEQGRLKWPDEPEGQQMAQAEQDIYGYLRQCLFTLPGAAVCVWQVEGQYVSALRLEPWKNGMLLTGLETAMDQRGKGYANALIRAVQEQLAQQGKVRLYSHIRKVNAASIHVHEKCGFRLFRDHAVFLDGSVDRRSSTYIYET